MPVPAEAIADGDIPAAFRSVPYDADRFGARDITDGANCQAFAYAVLRHFGRDVSDFRSSDLWEDTRQTERVAEPAPLDLLLFNRTAAGVGDLRVLIAPGPRGKPPVVTAYRPVRPEAKADEADTFESPVKRHTFQSVAAVPGVQVGVKPTKAGYVVEVQLPCDQVDLRDCGPGLRLRGDVGVLWGNEAGLATERRAYLFDRGPAAAVVSDAPTEAELQPDEWGVWVSE